MADVIICLGKNLRPVKHAKELEARVDRAIELYHLKRARHILLTGGRVRTDPQTQASYMAAYALARGVPKRAIVLEEHALTTVGNAHFSNIILHEKKWTSAIVVTSSHHLPRTKFIFDRILLGITLEYESANPPFRVRDFIVAFTIEIYKLIRMRLQGVYLTKKERSANIK